MLRVSAMLMSVLLLLLYIGLLMLLVVFDVCVVGGVDFCRC